VHVLPNVAKDHQLLPDVVKGAEKGEEEAGEDDDVECVHVAPKVSKVKAVDTSRLLADGPPTARVALALV